MHEATGSAFDAISFVNHAGIGRTVIDIEKKKLFFRQGDAADAAFYIREGRARLSVASPRGKEITIDLLSPGDFFGEECLAGVAGCRIATAVAITPCAAVRIDRGEMIRAVNEELAFAQMFLRFMLNRAMRTQTALIDYVFDSSEKRLAKALLLMADMGVPGQSTTLIPAIKQEALAEIVGTTRSRVSFFMNRFRERGFVEYDGRIRVHKPLLNLVLLE